MEFENLTGKVIGCVIEAHRELGPGLLESAYEHCLAHELIHTGLHIRRQVPLPVHYKGMPLDCAYRIDLLVEECLLIELKCTDRLLPIHEAQLMTYLRLARCRIGLLVNFNVPILKQGIKRFLI